MSIATLSTKTKLCPECNAKIIGRSDKKFCSDQCRSSYFRKNHPGENDCVKQTNHILKYNRNILENLFLENRNKVSKQILLDAGFRFSFFTNQVTTSKGKVYRFCYDYGFTETKTDHVSLVLKEAIVH